MRKYMKPSKLKTIVVKSLDWTNEIEIDSEIFDDVYVEAATRIVEKGLEKPNFLIAAVIFCYDKQDEKTPDKHCTCNTYHILVNAALYDKAELLRLNFLKEKGIDLRTQPVISYGSKRRKSNPRKSEDPSKN